jgi:hypothetical protein
LPSFVSPTDGSSTPITNWKAVANVWQSVQFSLIEIAKFSGTTVPGLPETSTIWIAIAVVRQFSQLA